MKQLLLTFGIISISMFFTSCLKNKSYTCECTYVPGFTLPAGTPEKIEKFTVQGRLREQAADNCSIDNEGKYTVQGYDGNCRLLD
ncbi:MAG TPA: hypothetical protein PKA54_09290 [Chitinophagaceae bacterium]|nr:MAG: hypothetical protein UZ11_BCD004001923 [Bacteroidetes bacterium OLB11]HMN33555.1 hypothetical protein [Chitinophagaceae bacterium]